MTEHWTENPNLLEKFVLGKVPPDRRSLLEEHLRTCAVCRQSVEREEAFVGTLRAYGRDQLKHRLKEKLGLPRGRSVPWPHVLSAAAIVLVVVGLGIYNRWWFRSEPIQSEREITAALKDEPAVQSTEETDEAGAEKPADQEQPQAPVSRFAQEPKSQTASKAAGEKKNADEVDTKEVLAPPAAREDQLAAAEERGNRLRKAEDLWVDGILTNVPSKSKTFRRAEGAGRNAAEEAQGKVEAFTGQKETFLLQQRPLSALPVDQRQKQLLAKAPTLVEQTDDGILLTVFTDEINLQKEKVRGEMAGRDSVVFLIDGKRIIYKLPQAALKNVK